MRRVFLDTNILIDYIQDREGGDDAKQLLLRGSDGKFNYMLPSSPLPTLHIYLMEK